MKKSKIVVLTLTLGMAAMCMFGCGKKDEAVSANTAPIPENNMITGDVENAVRAQTGNYKHEYTEEFGGEEVTRTDWIILYDDGTGYMVAQDAVSINSYIAGAFVLDDMTYVYTVDGDTVSIVQNGQNCVYTKTTDPLPQDVLNLIQ